MNIRKAQEKDIPKITELLSQVLELHARSFYEKMGLKPKETVMELIL